MTSAMGGDMEGKVTLTNEKVIGNGSFGVVFQVTDNLSNPLAHMGSKQDKCSLDSETQACYFHSLSFR
jgi:hypothetical protein